LAADFDFTAVGHILALLLGIGLSFRLPSMAHWTPIHVVLLGGGAVFGYFAVSGSSVLATVGGLAGTLLACLAGRVLRSPNANRVKVTGIAESRSPALHLPQSMPGTDLSPASR
jgi:hypothetical protein